MTFPGTTVDQLIRRLDDARTADPDIGGMLVRLDNNDLQMIDVMSAVVLGPLTRRRRNTPVPVVQETHWSFPQMTVTQLIDKLIEIKMSGENIGSMRVVLGSGLEDVKTIAVVPVRESPTSDYDYTLVLR